MRRDPIIGAVLAALLVGAIVLVLIGHALWAGALIALAGIVDLSTRGRLRRTRER